MKKPSQPKLISSNNTSKTNPKHSSNMTQSIINNHDIINDEKNVTTKANPIQQ